MQELRENPQSHPGLSRLRAKCWELNVLSVILLPRHIVRYAPRRCDELRSWRPHPFGDAGDNVHASRHRVQRGEA